MLAHSYSPGSVKASRAKLPTGTSGQARVGQRPERVIPGRSEQGAGAEQEGIKACGVREG